MEEMTLEQQQALARARARARLAQPTPQAPAKNGSNGPSDASEGFQRAGLPLGALGSGVADAGIKAFLGVKQLFGGLSDQDKAVLREMAKEAEADPSKGWRTAGDIAANIALTAVPASKAEKFLRGAQAVPSLLRSAAAAAGSAAATTGATAVGEGETFADQMVDKGKQAALSAAIAGPLAGAARVISRPFRPTAEAQKLIKQGINPTLQQGADSRTGRWIGGLTSGATDVRGRQEQEVAQAVLDRVTGGKVRIPHATGREILDAASNFTSKEYDEIFKGKRFPMAPKHVSGAMQAAQQINARGQFPGAAKEAGRAVAEVMGETGDRVRMFNYKTLMDDYLSPLSKAAYDEAPNEAVKNRILDARRYLINHVRQARLTPEQQAKLADIDVRNFDVERIREAVKGAIGEDEGLSLSRLAGAYAKTSMPGNTTVDDLIGPARRVLGNTPRQDQARTALITAGKIGTAGTLGAVTGLASVPAIAAGVGGLYGLSALGQTAAGARALMGETAAQKAFADLLRRGVIAPSAVALTPDMED